MAMARKRPIVSTCVCVCVAICRGLYTFTQESFEAGNKVVAAAVSAANLTGDAAFVPELTVTVEHRPGISLMTNESQCVLQFAGV